MNNDLNSLILSNARERVANGKGFKDWKSLDYMNQGAYVAQATEQAALLAMEELAGFDNFRLKKAKKHMADNGVIYIEDSESDLYTKYLNENKDE